MLVLGRYVDQKIMIGSDVTITIVGIKDGKVRLGIDAPRDIQVHREEVYEAINRPNHDYDSAAVQGIGPKPKA